MPAPAVMAGLSAASSMLGPLIGVLQNIKGPKKRREEQQAQQEAQRQAQLSQVAGQQQVAQNPGVVAGGGTLPLPSPPVPQAAPFQMPAPPQVQLQQPSLLGGQRNDYMMKLLMQGDR